jgi:hypothetical protein
MRQKTSKTNAIAYCGRVSAIALQKISKIKRSSAGKEGAIAFGNAFMSYADINRCLASGI